MIKKSEKIVVAYLSLELISIFICQVLNAYSLTDTYEFSKQIAIFGFVGLLLYIFRKIKYESKVNIYDFLIILLSGFGIISCIFAVDLDTALYGFKYRNEGFFVILSYYIFFLNANSLTNSKAKNILVNLILSIGFIEAFYAILQYFKVFSFFGIEIIRRFGFTAYGLEFNSNFLGSLLVINFTLSLVYYFYSKTTIKSIIYGILNVIFFLAFLTTGAMSGVVALFCMFCLLIVIAIKNKCINLRNIIKLLILLISFSLCYIKYDNVNEGYLKSQLSKMAYEMKETITAEVNERYGSGRIHIWKETINILPKYILTGCGVDNFYNAFIEVNNTPLIDVKSKYNVDKAHNEYLQKLITEGIFSFITYMSIIVIIIYKGIKKIFSMKNDIIFTACFLCYISYLIQAFFNISVISVAPTFYIIMGLTASFLTEKKNEN